MPRSKMFLFLTFVFHLGLSCLLQASEDAALYAKRDLLTADQYLSEALKIVKADYELNKGNISGVKTFYTRSSIDPTSPIETIIYGFATEDNITKDDSNSTCASGTKESGNGFTGCLVYDSESGNDFRNMLVVEVSTSNVSTNAAAFLNNKKVILVAQGFNRTYITQDKIKNEGRLSSSLGSIFRFSCYNRGLDGGLPWGGAGEVGGIGAIDSKSTLGGVNTCLADAKANSVNTE